MLPEGSEVQFKGDIRGDRVKCLEGNKLYRINDWLIRTMNLEHDGVINLGYYVMHTETEKTFFYATDTMYIKYKPENVNYWLIEVNYQDKYLEEAIKEGQADRSNVRRIKRSHMGLRTAKKFFKQQDLSDTKEIWLLHMSDRNSNPDEVREEVQGATGKVVKLA